MSSVQTGGGLIVPAGLSHNGQRAAEVIAAFLRKHGVANTGNCAMFQTPQEWWMRGEKHGCDSLLIIIHKSKDHSTVFEPGPQNDGKLREALAGELESLGVHIKNLSTWHSAVYPI